MDPRFDKSNVDSTNIIMQEGLSSFVNFVVIEYSAILPHQHVTFMCLLTNSW